MHIGRAIPSEVNVRISKEDAMADWAAITRVANDTKPFYIKHELRNDVIVWCINGSDGSNSCNDGYSLQSQSECEADLQNAPDNGVTYSCSSQNGKVITESYVGFVVTEEMASNNEGMKAGTYYLKGGNGGAAFLSNAKIIYDAFEGTGCKGDNNLPATYDSSYNPNSTSFFRCDVSGLSVYAGSSGFVSAGDNSDYKCYVGGDDFSHCKLVVESF